SAISFVTGGILVSRAFFLSPLISPRGCDFRPNGTILGACFSVAVPNMLQRFATCMGYVVFASMINALGDLSTAAHTVANTVESLFYIPGYGMQSAAGTLAGNAKGAGDERRLRSLTVMFIPLEIMLMIVSGALLFALAPSLLRLFSSDDRLIALGSTVLRMVAVSEPFFGVTIVLEGIMQGLGRTKEPFLFNVLGMWCIRIVGTFICTRLLGFGLVSAWACMVGHNLLLFVLYICKFALGNILSLDNKANA
ncbi:MAG: MATE family efflux transporter, partial [Oscillospiraceae bacterium]|nr:MATE family efflux transporter [Oscillospiraceae bacterium]